MGVPAGQLYDMGYFLHTTIIGTILAALGLFMLSLCKEQEFWQIILAEGVAVGVGSGLLYIPTLAIIGEIFKEGKERAIAMGTSGTLHYTRQPI